MTFLKKKISKGFFSACERSGDSFEGFAFVCGFHIMWKFAITINAKEKMKVMQTQKMIIKGFKYFMEFFVVLGFGWLFVEVFGSLGSGTGSISGTYTVLIWDLKYWCMYLAGVIWVSSSRIVQSLKYKA